uniref:serine/threonine-protein kinase 17A-like n=1 Tax=Myxine glutinosa TaxID=7769 RepID=UPI00358F0E8F
MIPKKISIRPGLATETDFPVNADPFLDKYKFVGTELGRGRFAVVKQCVELSSGRTFAAKRLRKRRRGEDCRADIIHEMAVLELARTCPHVVTLHEVFETSSDMTLVLEYVAGGDIFEQCAAVEEDEAFSATDIPRLIRQVLLGVAFLHDHTLAHLDLKPENILLTHTRPPGDIRIVDLGLARFIQPDQRLREMIGTQQYAAPEILDFEPISTATDMWNIGVLTYMMLKRELPFAVEDEDKVCLGISQFNVDLSPDAFENISSNAEDFIRSLLVKSPEDRATAEECLAHPWLLADLVSPSNQQILSSVEQPSGEETDSSEQISCTCNSQSLATSPLPPPPPPPLPPPPPNRLSVDCSEQSGLPRRSTNFCASSAQLHSPGHPTRSAVEDKENLPVEVTNASKRCKLAWPHVT